LCDRWLTSTPPVLRGAVMPFRREFAELALASAREMQLGHAKGIIYVGDGESETRIYQAALAGAPDFPADVSEWALEMAANGEGSARIQNLNGRARPSELFPSGRSCDWKAILRLRLSVGGRCGNCGVQAGQIASDTGANIPAKVPRCSQPDAHAQRAGS